MNPEELRELRKAAGLSMRDAARIFDTPYRTWQGWETGERRVPGIAGVVLKFYEMLPKGKKPL